MRHRYCPNCQANVKAVKNQPNHTMHLILTFVTFGLWMFVWCFLISWYAVGAHYHCTVCAGKVKRPKSLKKIMKIKMANQKSCYNL